MARWDSIQQTTVEIHAGRRKLIKTVAFTDTGALASLPATDASGRTIPKGACLILQADEDFLYELRDANAAASAVTVMGGTRPGTYVKALAEHPVHIHSDGTPSSYGADTQIDVIGASGAGNLSIFWVS